MRLLFTEMLKPKLYNQNYRDVIPSLADKSIDVVITDPPYFLHKMADGGWNETKPTKNSTVKSLPSGMKFDRKQAIAFGEFCEEWIRLLIPKLKPGAFLLSFSGARFYHRLVMAAEDNGLEIRDMLLWCHPGMPKAMKVSDGRSTAQLRSMYEPIMMANKLKEGTYESNWNKYHIGTLDLSCSDDGLTPGNMLVYPTAGKEEKRNNAHPTVKPLALMKRLVTMYSPKGALILDPFMGSGTTGVACVELDREFIGVELEKRYFDIADRRIKAAHSPTPQTTKGDLTEGYLPPSLTLDGNLFDIDLRP